MTLLSSAADPSTIVGRVTDDGQIPVVLRKNHILKSGALNITPDGLPTGFSAYLVAPCSLSDKSFPKNTFLLPDALSHLESGDVLRIDGVRKAARVIFRKRSASNSLLVTERCNSFCVMCSQPPRDIDDGYLVDQLLKAIPLMDKAAPEIMISGGEPVLLGKRLFQLLIALRDNLPATSVHVLTNGRLFSDAELAKDAARVKHPDLMFGIPLYSDISEIHDFVVQAKGGFDEALRGILNLKRARQKVEIRVVIHKETYSRLPQLAEFIRRNLLFVDQVVLMGLEHVGFAKSNLDALWIDPVDYQHELERAVGVLNQAGIVVKIYNHQLCTLSPPLRSFAVQSISDWKNEYLPECDTCSKKPDCGGFFFSTTERHSRGIRPIVISQ